MMKTALLYDEVTPGGEGSWVEAEYESPETIRALLAAMAACSDRAVPIPFGPNLVDALRRESPDLVLNIAEGREGPARESIAPAVLDYLRIPYAGADAVALGISLNKAITKHLARSAGIRTPDFRVCESACQAADAAAEMEFPVLVKPNFGGSSAGIGPESVVHNRCRLIAAVEACVAAFDQPCLVERYIAGTDVTVGLLGNDPVETFPAGRIIPSNGMYSAAAKKAHNREVICPCPLPDHLAAQLEDWSVAIFKGIGARDFARVDYMLDHEGNAWFLEINPLPGLSPYYGVLPLLAEAAGYTHTDLIGAIMRLALERSLHTRSSVHEGLAR
jgi:D-alanine-D-alanine ligase